ncbi:tail fiber [uncultured Mediterranean phage uvMED]|nr:tail fiber [uncultured Mediterranean phage uvMED]
MALDISATSPRVQYTVGSSSTTTFAYGFPIFQDADLKVFVGSTLKTLTTHYTVTGAGTTSGGNVVMTTGNEVTNADVTIVRDITISRTTDFPTSGSFQVDSLNTELDTITAVQQELEDDISRSLKLSDEDSTATLTLPLKDARKGRYLAFNATTGNAEAGPTQTDATLIATVTTDIALLADIQDGTTATNTLTTLSPKATEIGLLGNSTTVANMGLLGTSAVITDMGLLGTSAVVEDMGFLGTSANVTAMGHLGTSANVTAMGKLGNDATVADMAILGTDDVVADMNTLATSDIISDLNTLATSDIVTDMNLLATSANVTAMGHLGTSANVTAMGLLGTSAVVEDMGFLGTSANVTAMGNLGTSTNVTNMANLNASGVITNIANLNATDVITNIGTVASNVSGVNSFADRYRVASSAPTSSLDVGDLYFDTSANELKVYKASGWSAAGSTVNGTSARFHYDISGTPSSVSGSDSAGNTLAYDAGFVDVYVNGVRMAPEDITITSGTSVVFASALADGDDVDIVAFGTFQVANIVSTGALNSGSITSGFGNIDNGSSTITTTGAISGGTLTASTGTFSGILKTDDTTDATSTTDGSLQTDGGLSVAKDAVIGDDLTLKSDSSVLAFGADADVKLTHVHDTGLILSAGGQTTSDFGTPANGMKDFVIGGDGNVGMSILTTANNNVRLAFGDVDDPDEGQLNYDCNAGTLQFQIDGDSAFKMHNLASFLTASLEAQGGIAMADEASATFRAGPGLILVSNRSLGHSAIYHVDYIGTSPTELSDPNSQFRNDDTDGFICVFKSSNSYDVTIKNRQGASRGLTVVVLSSDF